MRKCDASHLTVGSLDGRTRVGVDAPLNLLFGGYRAAPLHC
jgi:hypothetical protein